MRSLETVIDKLISFLFNLVFGILLGSASVALAAWVCMALYRVELAFDAALWVLENAPLQFTGSPVILANEAIQRGSLIAAGVLATFLGWVAANCLLAARRSFRPAGESRGGNAQMVLKTPHPRVGDALEGRLRLMKDPNPGDSYQLELYCERRYTSGSKDQTERAFYASLDVLPAQDAEGWYLPFRFDVPVTAPASSASDMVASERYYWQLDFHRTEAWLSFPGDFGLTLAPADAAALRAVEATETPEQKAAIEDLAGVLGAPLLPHQRAQMQALSPADLAMARKVTSMPAKIMKWLFIGFFVIPMAIMALMFGVGMLLAP
jgi:hypothetical protein